MDAAKWNSIFVCIGTFAVPFWRVCKLILIEIDKKWWKIEKGRKKKNSSPQNRNKLPTIASARTLWIDCQNLVFHKAAAAAAWADPKELNWMSFCFDISASKKKVGRILPFFFAFLVQEKIYKISSSSFVVWKGLIPFLLPFMHQKMQVCFVLSVEHEEEESEITHAMPCFPKWQIAAFHRSKFSLIRASPVPNYGLLGTEFFECGVSISLLPFWTCSAFTTKAQWSWKGRGFDGVYCSLGCIIIESSRHHPNSYDHTQQLANPLKTKFPIDQSHFHWRKRNKLVSPARWQQVCAA